MATMSEEPAGDLFENIQSIWLQFLLSSTFAYHLPIAFYLYLDRIPQSQPG